MRSIAGGIGAIHTLVNKMGLVIVRKYISVQKGENVLFDEVRYFFYITNRRADTVEKIVGLATAGLLREVADSRNRFSKFQTDNSEWEA